MLPGFRTLFLYYATHPTVATTICYIVGNLGISVVTVGYPLPVIPVPGIWDVPPGGRVPGGWYAPLPPPGVLAGAGLPAGVLPYRPGGSHSGYSGFYWTGPAGLPSPAPLFANPAAFSAWALASIAAEISADINAFLAWLRHTLLLPSPRPATSAPTAQAQRGGERRAIRGGKRITKSQYGANCGGSRGSRRPLDFEEVAMALRISFGLFVASAVALAVASRARPRGRSWRARRPLRLPLGGRPATSCGWRSKARSRETTVAATPSCAGPLRAAEERVGPLATRRAADRGPLAIPARGRAFGQRGQRLAEYSRRRDAAGASAADHAALARWCRKNRLDQQQRAEWCASCAEPANPEAIWR